MESMAFDDVNDILYVFSGNCCVSTVLPTVFRLVRDGSGTFQVESYQPLSSSSDFTASAWNRERWECLGGEGPGPPTYNYATNAIGPVVRVPNLTGILGLDFSDAGADLFAVTNTQRLIRVNWATKTIINGWNFDLTPSGVRDSRAVDADRGSVLRARRLRRSLERRSAEVRGVRLQRPSGRPRRRRRLTSPHFHDLRDRRR